MTVLNFPGGPAVIEPERVWADLQRWLGADVSRRCDMYCEPDGQYCCWLTWFATSCIARSQLGIADAVANALQAAGHLQPDSKNDKST